MSATFNEISSKLSSKNPIIIIQKDINISNYYYIESDFDNLNSYSLYICKLSNFPSQFTTDEHRNFLIIVDVHIEYDLFKLKNCNIIIIEQNKIKLYKLLEDLQYIINLKSDIITASNSILNSISKNEGINNIINILYDHLKNPIIIANDANYLCSYNNRDYNLNNAIWKDYIKYKYPDPYYLDKIYYNIRAQQSLSKKNEPIIIDSLNIMEDRVIVCPIIINNFNMAYIYVLESNKKFTENDIKLLNSLKKILAPVIINDLQFDYTHSTQLNSIFYYMLSAKNVEPHFLDKTCEILNLNPKSDFFLVTISFPNKSMDTKNLKNTYNLIKQIFFNQFLFIYKNNICVLYIDTKNKNPKDFKIESEIFLEQCNKHNMIVGVSDTFSNLHNIKLAYEQTLKAIDFSRKSENNSHVFYYCDFMLMNVVHSFLINEYTNTVVDLNFMKFINSASEEYLEMLKIFIDNNGNIKKSADELHIHYNTLKYRLNKISDEYCMDLDDLNYIIKLKLSYIALDFIENS